MQESYEEMVKRLRKERLTARPISQHGKKCKCDKCEEHKASSLKAFEIFVIKHCE